MVPGGTMVMLFVIATAVAIGAQRMRVPYTVALVLVGVSLGSLEVMDPPALTKELLFAFILPGLLFETAFHMEHAELRHRWRSIATLAGPGVAIAIALTGLLLTTMLRWTGLDSGFSLSVGLVFGALVAATDPIAVVALFRSMRAPARLTSLIEAESLFNDGTAIVFLIVLVDVLSGATATAGGVLMQLLAMVGTGVAVGAAVGYVVAKALDRLDDPMLEITLTVIAAYGAFTLSEQVHGSGVLATVVAGLLCGGAGRRGALRPASELAVTAFWEYAAFALNSIVFLLVGFAIPLPRLASAWPLIAVAFVAALAGRAVVVAATAMLYSRTVERFPSRWAAVLTWGGLRGALSVVLVLSLPAAIPRRELLETLTFGVVLVSLTVQGISIGWVLRRAGLVAGAEGKAAGDAAPEPEPNR